MRYPLKTDNTDIFFNEGNGEEQLQIASGDGWVASGETWTYASATTFTISGDKTAKYNKGDKIKLENTSVKYFYIVDVSYSSPNTTITVTGGTDYTLANSTIASPYYSKQNPTDFPHFFNYTPTYSASGSMTFTSVTTRKAIFSIVHNQVNVILDFTGTTGGTASTGITATLPVTASDGFNRQGVAINDNSVKLGFSLIDSSGATFYRSDQSNWGLGSSKYCFLTTFYNF